MNAIEISAVIPVYNEAENLIRLHAELTRELEKITRDFEIIIVDDGSTDATSAELGKINDVRLRRVTLAHNAGISAALAAGIQAASGRYIVTLDGDLQNDPADIPKLRAAIGDHDAVVTWRRAREDNLLRRFLSRLGNLLRNLIIGENFHDSSSTLRLYKSEAIKSIELTDGMHRFIPTLLRLAGYRLIEVPINHRPRGSGKSKIGLIARIIKTGRDVFHVRRLKKSRKT